MKLSRTLFLFFFALLVFLGGLQSASALSSDLNANGIPDADETEVVVSSNVSLPAGEYVFNNLTIANNAVVTLDGDVLSPSFFKGVKITAKNITIASGSSLSADHQGYGRMIGPGAPTLYSAGASYGGVGLGDVVAPIYGSATHPIDLGSGGYASGGGAIRLVISETLRNDGEISARGDASASGGSIHVTAHTLSGAGLFSADGGSLAYFQGPGGGGRIALYYDTSSFTGAAEAKGGCASYDGFSKTCAGDGTVGFFDTTHNDLHVDSSWRFQKNDEPFNFNDIFVTNGAHVTTENDVGITSARITLDAGSSLFLSPHDVIAIPHITVTGGSTLTLSGEETIIADTLALTGNGTVTVVPEHILSLTIPHITVSADSVISANEKGYGYNSGPGAPISVYAGASYGGLGAGNAPASLYGSSTAPTDFGSGGIGYHPHGGGAIRLVATSTLSNDGIISADGSNTSSGGSVYVTAGAMSGSGVFRANGGGAYCPYSCIGPGGGGRVALYYATSTFIGIAEAKGGCASYDGFSKTCAGDGTVVVSALTPAKPACTSDCFSNVLFLPGLEASRLYKQKTVLGFPVEDQLWEPDFFGDVDDLYLDTSGHSIDSAIYTKDVIDKASLRGLFSVNIYKSLISNLDNLVSTQKINEWKPYAYDWRQGIDDIVQNGTKYNDGQTISLVDTLRSLVTSSKTGKVAIIAHSNGGLLAKALIKKLEDMKIAGQSDLADHIDVLILVASPQIGTPNALSGLLNGYKQSIPGKLMSEAQARKLAQNMSSSYGLLPASTYFTQTGIINPVRFSSSSPQIYTGAYGTDINTYQEEHNFVLGQEGRTAPNESDLVNPIIGNSTLLTQAERLHNSIDTMTFPSLMKVLEVAGWGKETIAGITYTDLDIQPLFTIRGDNTVVMQSALYGQATKYWLDLSNSKLEHKNILEDPQLLDFIDQTIEQKPLVFSFITDTEPIQLGNRLHLSVHSPVSIGIYDTAGNFTGKTCDDTTGNCSITENIPGSTYFEFGEGKYVNLGQGNFQKALLQGTGVGTFTFASEVVTPSGGSSTSSFIDIPVTTQTQAEITLNPVTQTPQLKLDVTGDGVPDFTLAPSAVFDPITYLQVMKATIDSLDLPQSKKNAFDNRVDTIIKLIQKGKINKAKLQADTFKKVLENKITKPDPKKPKPKKLSKTDAQLLLDLLNGLLDNLN